MLGPPILGSTHRLLRNDAHHLTFCIAKAFALPGWICGNALHEQLIQDENLGAVSAGGSV
jgi:hypothetical protein